MTAAFRSIVSLLITPILVSYIVGCASARVLETSEALNAAEENIRVQLHDRRIIRFWAGSYTVAQGTDSNYISGEGLESAPERPGEKKWEGSIQHREIEQIEVVEPNSVPMAMLLVALAVTAIAYVGALGLSGQSIFGPGPQ